MNLLDHLFRLKALQRLFWSSPLFRKKNQIIEYPNLTFDDNDDKETPLPMVKSFKAKAYREYSFNWNEFYEPNFD